jgi:hypothetical protein
MSIKSLSKSLALHLHRHKKSEADLFIFSLPRTGSTLLAEVLNTDSRSKTASESFALNKDNTRVLRKYFDKNFLAERYVDISNGNLQQMFNYFNQLSEGKTWNSYYWSDFFTPSHRFSTTRTIFKTHRITYYFDDLLGHFKDDYGLYLIRHPVSHSLSRLRLGLSAYIDLFAQSDKIKDTLPPGAKETISRVNSRGSDLEKFLVSWCLENYVFIKKYQEGHLPPNVFAVFYEELVFNPEQALRDICHKIKMEYTDKMLSIIDLPSSGIVHSTEETEKQIEAGNKNYLANRWKEGLSTLAQEQIKDILTSFGIKIYLD